MTKETIQILKSFTPVNTSFTIKNDVIAVLSPDSACCVIYNPSDLTEFDKEAAIYNVTEFLNVLETLGDDSEIEVQDNTINIINGRKKIKYLLSSKSVKSVPTTIDKKFEGLSNDVVFTLNKNDLGQITKISGLLSLDKVILKTTENGVLITLAETGNDSSDSLNIELDGTGTEGIELSISTEELGKLIPGDYSVVVSESGMSKFTSKTIDTLRYYIANKAD